MERSPALARAARRETTCSRARGSAGDCGWRGSDLEGGKRHGRIDQLVAREKVPRRGAFAHPLALRGAAWGHGIRDPYVAAAEWLRSAASNQAHRSLSQASSRRRLWPAAASTALIASPAAPARWLRSSR